MKTMIKASLTIIALSLSLQGCFFAVGAAAGAAGVAGIYDHRKVEQIAADQRIGHSIDQTIRSDPKQASSHIDVTSFNNVVLLTGQTISPTLRQDAERIAKDTANVKKVYNEIAIKGPTSSLTRTSDTWITTKIKTQMLATEGLKSGSLKVLTENGNVYLMGIVSRDQADIAVEIARQVDGVQRVVKVFQYTN